MRLKICLIIFSPRRSQRLKAKRTYEINHNNSINPGDRSAKHFLSKGLCSKSTNRKKAAELINDSINPSEEPMHEKNQPTQSPYLQYILKT